MSQKETRIWVSTLSKEEPFWSVWGKQDEQKWWKRWFTVFKNYGFPLCLLLNIWVLVCHTFSNLRFVPVNFHQILKPHPPGLDFSFYTADHKHSSPSLRCFVNSLRKTPLMDKSYGFHFSRQTKRRRGDI